MEGAEREDRMFPEGLLVLRQLQEMTHHHWKRSREEKYSPPPCPFGLAVRGLMILAAVLSQCKSLHRQQGTDSATEIAVT